MRQFSKVLLIGLVALYAGTAMAVTLPRSQKNSTWEQTRAIINGNSSKLEGAIIGPPIDSRPATNDVDMADFDIVDVRNIKGTTGALGFSGYNYYTFDQDVRIASDQYLYLGTAYDAGIGYATIDGDINFQNYFATNLNFIGIELQMMMHQVN